MVDKHTDLLCLGEPLIELNQQADGRYLAGIGGDVAFALESWLGCC